MKNIFAGIGYCGIFAIGTAMGYIAAFLKQSCNRKGHRKEAQPKF